MNPDSARSFHFLIADLKGIAAGFVLFPLLAFLPGYAIGWLSNVFRFRERLLPFRLAASVPLSLAMVPVTSYTVGRWLGLDAVWFVYVALVAAAVLTGALRSSGRPLAGFDLATLWPFAAMIAAWLVIATFSLADLPIGRRLYFSIIHFDYAVRTAFTHSIAAFGLPAQNPFFYPGHATALRYHYFWMIVCAQISRLGRPVVDAREAFMAGTLWTGIGLMALIPLYLRLFWPDSGDLVRRSRIGIALLAVTGLDIVPAMMMVWLGRIGMVSGMSPSVEWWNEQVDGFLYTMLWEPHYVVSLIGSLTAFLILWSVPPESVRRERLVSGALAGMALATAAGSGIYIAMVFAVFLGLWFAVAVVMRRWRDVETMAMAGVVALGLILPFLAGLQGSSGGSGGPRLLQLTIRDFTPAEMVLRLFGMNQQWQRYVALLVSLPLNYFLELGLFFLAGRVAWKRFWAQKRPATRMELAAFLMLATSVTICTFVKSSIIANNDLGWRGFLPAQFILLLCAVEFLSARSSRTFGTIVLLVLGLTGVVYDLAILRLYPVLSDLGTTPKIGWVGHDNQVGLRTSANREAYEWIRGRTPETAILEQNPAPDYQDTYWGDYGQRQTAAIGEECGSGFGGDKRECGNLLPTLTGLFAGGGKEKLEEACRAVTMNIVVAKDTDVPWHDRDSWVWAATPVFQNGFVRVFDCDRQ